MLSKERRNAIKEELQTLIKDGRLNPEDVVDAARNPNSSLHSYFTWDDTEAAAAFRLQEARALIKRVKVNVVRTDDTIVHVPSFIRSSEGKGYQNIAVMLTNKPSHINIILITLAQVSTMLKNLAAPGRRSSLLMQVVVPTSLISKVLDVMHSSIYSGHRNSGPWEPSLLASSCGLP